MMLMKISKVRMVKFLRMQMESQLRKDRKVMLKEVKVNQKGKNKMKVKIRDKILVDLERSLNSLIKMINLRNKGKIS